jgi:hypothetical protein
VLAANFVCYCLCRLQLQSVQLPFALIPVLAFNASETLMGKFVNSKATIACTVAISLAVMVVNVSGVMAFFQAALDGSSIYLWTALAVGVVIYLLFVGYLFLHATAAAGLLPPVIGFVARQPGGESSNSMGGGVFVALPYENSDSSEAAADEEAGTDVIHAFPSPSSRAAAAGQPSSEDEVHCLSDGGGASSSGSSRGSGSYNNGAWLAHGLEAVAAEPQGSSAAGDEEQQLSQPLLLQAGARGSS